MIGTREKSTYRGSLLSEIGSVQPSRWSSSLRWCYQARSNLSDLQPWIQLHCSSVSRARDTRAPEYGRHCLCKWCKPLKNDERDLEQVMCLSPRIWNPSFRYVTRMVLWSGVFVGQFARALQAVEVKLCFFLSWLFHILISFGFLATSAKHMFKHKNWINCLAFFSISGNLACRLMLFFDHDQEYSCLLVWAS